MQNTFVRLLLRDLLISFRHPLLFLNPLLFFILITLLFPLAITSDPLKLSVIGPGVIWISLLFANLLAIENMFVDDFEDGSLEHMALCHQPLFILVVAKLLAHWLITSLPLILTSFVISRVFFIPINGTWVLILSLLLGTPVLTLIGAMGSVLTLGLKNRGLLLILMILPLYLPVLIFGAGSVNDVLSGLPVISQLCFLGAFLTLSLTFLPFAVAAGLRIALE